MGRGAWQSRCGSCRATWPAFYDLDWSPDGTRLASAGSDTEVSIWEVADRARGSREACYEAISGA